MINIKLDKKAKSVIAKTADFSGEGGTVVVTKLPETGDEHTIYELQETSKASYGWVFRKLPTSSQLSSLFLVFDTYEQMTSTFNSITITKDGQQFQVYIRNENKMYCVWFEYPKEGGDPYWVFNEEPKKEDESGTEYAFQLETIEDYQTFYILKEFVGNKRPIIDGGYAVSYLTLDDKEVYIGYEGRGYILSDIVHPNEVTAWDFIIEDDIITSNALPNSVELETNYYNLLRATNGRVTCYNTSDNKYYDLIQEADTYYWYNNPQNREDCYFAVRNRKPAEPPLHYEGELEWEEINASTTKFNDIPYNDIINCSGKGLSWVFQPSKAGEVTSTYWIYTNDKWVNVDEIDTNPSLHKTVFGTLTYTGDESELQCSLTLEEMASAIDQGNFVVLELNMGDESRENYYYCAIGDVTVGGEGPDSVDIFATWSFAQGYIFWNSSTGAFAFNNGIM